MSNGNSPFALPKTWKFSDLKQVLTEPLPPGPPWLIKGLVAERCGTMISSQPHGIKSFSWLQASIEAPILHKIWGHFDATPTKRTLFLETEDPEWLVKQRIHAICKADGIKAEDLPDGGFFTVGCLGPFDLISMESHLKSSIEKYKPDFTVLSTLQGLLGGRDWKEQSEMGAINSLLVSISTDYSPLVVITHSPWDSRQRRAAGTVTQAANYPTLCHYQKFKANGDDYASVHIDSKIGYAEDGSDFKLHFKKYSEIEMRVEFQKPTDTQNIISHIQANPKAKPAEIAAQFGISDRYVRKLRSKVQ